MIYYKVRQIQAKNYILETPAISPAIELSYIKEVSKIDNDAYDSLLLSLIKVATEYGEKITGRDFINKTYKGFLNCFPACTSRGIQIRKAKLQSITSIQYYVDGILTTFDSSNYYITESDNGYSSIYLNEDKEWPSDVDNRQQAVVITFVAGYGEDSCDIPATLQRAMAAHIELLRANSGDCEDVDGVSRQAMQLYQPFTLSNKKFCVV
jgi:uncharacterized phiE125 gp8 family phage protein